MGYQRGDNRPGSGEERWQGNRYEREGGSFGNWGSNRDRGDWDRGRDRGSMSGGDWDRGRERGSGDWGGGRSSHDDDRGFFERAGEQVKSWFSDDEDRGGRGGYQREGGGWDRDRGQERSRGSGGGGYAQDHQASGGGGGGGADSWGGSGFGGLDDNGRRFDRVDPGHVGSQGAHPMSAPVGGGYGTSAGGFGSSARSAAIMRQAQQHGPGGSHHDHHDRHYSEWRNRQMQELDRDYDEYRREHQSKFEQEFGGWRQKRQTQRQHMGRATHHMEVIGADGQHIGTVDAVKGDRIILTKNDENAGGMHHSIPCSWIETVDDKVTVNKTAEEAMRAWKEEEGNRALFERPDQGSEGPHMLNRSFSGTYDDKR